HSRGFEAGTTRTGRRRSSSRGLHTVDTRAVRDIRRIDRLQQRFIRNQSVRAQFRIGLADDDHRHRLAIAIPQRFERRQTLLRFHVDAEQNDAKVALAQQLEGAVAIGRKRDGEVTLIECGDERFAEGIVVVNDERGTTWSNHQRVESGKRRSSARRYASSTSSLKQTKTTRSMPLPSRITLTTSETAMAAASGTG